MLKTAQTPVTERWKSVCGRISALKSPQKVTLVAVSKGHSVDSVLPLLEEGQRDFGENRVQEAESKWPELKRRYPDLRLHLIGPLQSNKVKQALELFDVIHTVDRESIAEALLKETAHLSSSAAKAFFIQVNTGQEPQKSGVAPAMLSAFLRSLPLSVTGLMCIPPANEPPAPHFALLRKMAREAGLLHLSMGMSHDFETAVRLGATHVRVGTEIFGEREA